MARLNGGSTVDRALDHGGEEGESQGERRGRLEKGEKWGEGVKGRQDSGEKKEKGVKEEKGSGQQIAHLGSGVGGDVGDE